MSQSKLQPASKPKVSGAACRGEATVAAYSRTRPAAQRAICELLRARIDAALPGVSSRIWHGGPVWFLGENPVVGYDASAKGVKLLFWNGQAFDEPELEPIGKYGAAQIVIREAAQLDAAALRRWLKKARSDVFDSKAFFAKLRAKKASASARPARKDARS